MDGRYRVRYVEMDILGFEVVARNNRQLRDKCEMEDDNTSVMALPRSSVNEHARLENGRRHR